LTRPRTASVTFILVTLLLDTLGIGLIIPVMPRLIASFTGGTLSASSTYYGALISLYAAMQFIFAPIVGGLSDRFGRRVVILTSLAGAACNYLLLGLLRPTHVLFFVQPIFWLFVGRIVAGITGASFSAATAYITDVTPPEKRAQSFGLIGAAFGLGFILGPALGGLVGEADLQRPFLVAAAMNLLNFVYGIFVLPESLSVENRRKFSFARANPFSSLVNLGRHPIIFGLTGTLVCSLLAQQVLQAMWSVYTDHRFNWSPKDIGLSLGAVGVTSIIVQGGLIRAIVPRLGERRALLLGIAMSALGYVGFALASQGWMMYAILLPFSLGGVAGPATQSLISREVAASEQGELQGSLTSLQSVAAIIMPSVATWLFRYFTAGGGVPNVPGAPFFAAAGLHVIGFFLAVRLFASFPRKPATSEAAPRA
jgi:DHA1 family tetracycline resistance protein-like MFS transporter